MSLAKEIYFVADVHLGLKLNDPEDRERRFVDFLKNIPRDRVKALYLLGDIWDFWYEYRDVIPSYAPRVLAQIMNLLDDGIEVYFCSGNHDIWTFSFFEKIGIKVISQPHFFESEGKKFCVGHGDLLGGAKFGYKLMLSIFRCKAIQFCFSLLHPWLAYRIGLSWSNSNRRTHKPYIFKGKDEPLYKFSSEVLVSKKVNYFIFGHYHIDANISLSDDSQLFIIKDWIDGGQPYGVFNGETFELHS